MLFTYFFKASLRILIKDGLKMLWNNVANLFLLRRSKYTNRCIRPSFDWATEMWWYERFCCLLFSAIVYQRTNGYLINACAVQWWYTIIRTLHYISACFLTLFKVNIVQQQQSSCRMFYIQIPHKLAPRFSLCVSNKYYRLFVWTQKAKQIRMAVCQTKQC